VRAEGNARWCRPINKCRGESHRRREPAPLAARHFGTSGTAAPECQQLRRNPGPYRKFVTTLQFSSDGVFQPLPSRLQLTQL
jgi:hypothetical protein